jgi:hypothetical protein
MNRILLIILFLFFSQINTSNAEQRELSKGTAVVFGADVLLRALPSQTGNIVDVLPIASKIEIVDKASLLTKLDNISDYWYKVKYNDEEGFLWGVLIADNYYEGDLDTDGSTETFMLLNLTQTPYDASFSFDNSKIEFRVARNGQMINEHKQYTEFLIAVDSIHLEKLTSFTPELSVIRLSYTFTGIIGGNAEQFFRFSSNSIDSLFTIHYLEGEGGTLCFSTLILPSDKNGQPNTVVIKSKVADTLDCDYKTENPPCKWEYFDTTLIWDGKKFTKKK